MTKVSNNPLISVIVPVYNVEKYLNRCIDSIINQKYKNLEIILVDDGSPDKCPKICDDYAKKDSRIKVIHKKNGGLSSARNAGIELATGDYIGFVDSDDWISSKMYEVLLFNMQKYNADISVCELTRNEKKLHFEDNYDAILYTKNEYLKRFFKINCQCTEYYATTKLFKKNLLSNNQFPVGLTSEDVYGVYKAILKSNNIVKVNLNLYYYLQNNNSITGNFSEKDYDLIKIWDLVVKYAESNDTLNLNYAILNRKRIDFTLLYRISKSYKISYIKNDKRISELLESLKKNEKYLLKSNIVFSRKILIFFMCLNYNLFSIICYSIFNFKRK